MAKMILDNEEVEINVDDLITQLEALEDDGCDCNGCAHGGPCEDDEPLQVTLKLRFSEQLFRTIVDAPHWDENSKNILRDVNMYVRAVSQEVKQDLRKELFAPRTVLFEVIDKDLKTALPEYSSEHASGMDVRANGNPGYWNLKPNEVVSIPTNLKMEIPVGYEIQVRPRSGLALKGMTIANTPGTIDADYRGELKVLLVNRSGDDFLVESGDRIAQLVLCKVEHADVIEIDKVSDTKRGDCGFGHTGVK